MNSLGFKVGGLAGSAVLVGVASGLVAWYLENALSSQINAKPWLLPVLGGLAGAGATVAVVVLKTNLMQ